MSVAKKILYSIFPSFLFISIILILMGVDIMFSEFQFNILNVLYLVQLILLFVEMNKNKIPISKRILYIFLLIIILPFHYVLIWYLMDKKSKPIFLEENSTKQL